MIKHAAKSALFGALGPLFNKMTTWEYSKPAGRFIKEHQLPYSYLVAFNIICLAIMISFNTASVKHKMLCYRLEGAFLGTTLMFSLGYLFSTVLGIIIGEGNVPPYKYLGFLLILIGVMLISAEPKSILLQKSRDVVEDVVSHSSPSTPQAEMNKLTVSTDIREPTQEAKSELPQQ